MSSEKSPENVKDLVLKLLKTTEELKSIIPPLIKGQDYGERTLETHTDALEKLMRALLTLKRDNEMIHQELKEYSVDHKLYEELAERVSLLENKFVSEIVEKAKLGKEITESDVQELELLVKKQPSEPTLWVTLGLIYLKKDHAGKSLECFNKALQIDDKYIRAWCLKGVALQLLEKHEEALDVFESTRKLFDCPVLLRHEAHSMVILGKNEQALDFVNLAIEGDREDAMSWAMKGRILHDMERDTEALGCLEKALELQPDLVVALNQKGIILAGLGSEFLEDSLACFERITQLLPNSHIAWHNMGLGLSNLGRDKEAIKCFNKAVKLNPKYTCPYCSRGMCKANLRDFLGALEDINKALDLGLPKNCGVAYAAKAFVLGKLGRYEEALLAVDKGLSAESDVADLWTQKAQILVYLKREGESKKCVEAAIKSQPKEANSLNAIAFVLDELREYPRALEFACKAVEIEPNIANYLDTQACILYQLKRDQEALEIFKKALKLRKSDADINWSILAELYARIGKSEEAERIRKEHLQ